MTPVPVLAPGALARAASILVIKLDELGDFVLATPFLRGLRASAPQARIVLAVTPPVMELADRCPYVDATVTPTAEEAEDSFNFRGRTADDMRVFAAAFGATFDIVVTLRYDFDKHGAATLASATRAPVRLAHSEKVTPWKATTNRGFDAAYTHVLPAGPVCHEVESNLALLAALGGSDPAGGGVEMFLSAAERHQARARLADGFPAGRPRRLLAVAHTTSSPRRNYPVESLRALLVRVAGALAIDGAVLLGGPDAAERSALLAAGLPCPTLDLTGRTTIRDCAAIIAGCDALLSMDSGPAHMAAAVGTPVAALFSQPVGGDPQGPNAPERFRPWTPDALVIQPPHAVPPCTDKCVSLVAHCIATIDPAEAADGITAFLVPIFERREARHAR